MTGSASEFLDTSAPVPQAREPGIAIAATFTATGILKAAAGFARALDRPVHGAPYGQVLEALLDPNGVILANSGVNALFLRVEDLRGSGPSDADRLLDELLDALRSVPSRSVATWLVVLTPPSPRALADSDVAGWVERATARITSTADSLPGVYPVSPDGLAERHDLAGVHDEYSDRVAHLPYTDEFDDALAELVVRLAASTWRRPRKVVVADCDNTLWDGVCGEVGPLGVHVAAGHRRVQEFLRAERARGKLICLCSRNAEADVAAVFGVNPGMVLKLSEVTATRIGWRPKTQYLRELSDQLDLALNAFVFIDDDPVECAAVRDQLPEVAVVEVPAGGEGAWRALTAEWAFDQLGVTEEDQLRADWYAAEPQRRSLQESASDYADFLARCRIEVELRPLDDDSLERAAQLTSRTTQFTLTQERYTVPELRRFLADGGLGRAVRVRDVFGDYGTVGLVLAAPDGDRLDVPTFLLSCRMLNREVEPEVLRQLCAQARDLGCRTVRLRYRPTGRNAPARQFLERISDTSVGPDDPPGEIDVDVDRYVPPAEDE